MVNLSAAPIDLRRMGSDPTYRSEVPMTPDAARVLVALLGGAVATQAQVATPLHKSVHLAAHRLHSVDTETFVGAGARRRTSWSKLGATWPDAERAQCTLMGGYGGHCAAQPQRSNGQLRPCLRLRWRLC